MTEHKAFDRKLVRIPEPRPGRINPAAGKVAVAHWAGWDDEYCLFVDGVYHVRAKAAEIAPHILEDA